MHQCELPSNVLVKQYNVIQCVCVNIRALQRALHEKLQTRTINEMLSDTVVD